MFKRTPVLWNNQRLAEYCKSGEKQLLKTSGGETWVPARPIMGTDSFTNRLSLAWMVFTGKADAVFWTGDE